MDSLILKRLLTPEDLAQHISRHLQLDGAVLLSATAREVDAPGYLSDLVGVTLEWNRRIEAPTQAVLKVSHAGFGQPELPFYESVAQRLNSTVVPHFYGGGIDEQTGRTWLLMEDLSFSHERPSAPPLPPRFARSVQIVEALARFHAAGWHKNDWHDAGPSMWTRLRSSDWLEAGCNQLLSQVGDAADQRIWDAYARLQLGFPTLIEKAERLRGRTLVHGDAHVWNWMLPREGRDGEPKLIDWDGWHLGVGAWDLAYMMAVQWDRSVRQRFEMQLLDYYHAALVASGITDYSRNELQSDYRLAVLLHMRTPIARFVRKMSAYVWWPQITRIQDAVEDLQCLDLLT